MAKCTFEFWDLCAKQFGIQRYDTALTVHISHNLIFWWFDKMKMHRIASNDQWCLNFPISFWSNMSNKYPTSTRFAISSDVCLRYYDWQLDGGKYNYLCIIFSQLWVRYIKPRDWRAFECLENIHWNWLYVVAIVYYTERSSIKSSLSYFI